jgi:Sap, sulfolipid-1-addressing protein
MSGAETELLLVSLAAMMSPTTLSFSVFVLVLAKRPLWSGLWFYLGALSATLLVGIVAAFVLGDAATSRSGTTKTWVAVIDVIAGAALVMYAARLARRPRDPDREEQTIAKMRSVASAGIVATFGAGAALANAGAFIPIALKDISQLDPTPTLYLALWAGFALVSLLPLATALVLLAVAPGAASRGLAGSRSWLDRHVHMVAAALILALGVVLLRNGIAGL